MENIQIHSDLRFAEGMVKLLGHWKDSPLLKGNQQVR